MTAAEVLAQARSVAALAHAGWRGRRLEQYGYRAIEDVRPCDWLYAPELAPTGIVDRPRFVRVIAIDRPAELYRLHLETEAGHSYTRTLAGHRMVGTYYVHRHGCACCPISRKAVA